MSKPSILPSSCPLHDLRVLVCGGRTFGVPPRFFGGAALWKDRDKAAAQRFQLQATLDVLDVDHGIILVIHGAAKGADSLAAAWARRKLIADLPFQADWKTHGKAAGPIRNQRMLDEGKPDLIVAFPGGKGTANMVALARAANIPVIEITDA